MLKNEEENKMINEMKFNEDVAMMCGLKEAVLASFLWDLVANEVDTDYYEWHNIIIIMIMK